jgi:hypothetical protein
MPSSPFWRTRFCRFLSSFSLRAFRLHLSVVARPWHLSPQSQWSSLMSPVPFEKHLGPCRLTLKDGDPCLPSTRWDSHYSAAVDCCLQPGLDVWGRFCSEMQRRQILPASCSHCAVDILPTRIVLIACKVTCSGSSEDSVKGIISPIFLFLDLHVFVSHGNLSLLFC